MARDYLEREVGTSRDYQCTFMGQQDNARCVRWRAKSDVFILTDPKPVSEMGLLDMTSELWKVPTTD